MKRTTRPPSPPPPDDAARREALPRVTGPHVPVQLHAPAARRAPPASAGAVPVGYVVASAFFLAIAAVGFGLWLAFDVIAL